MVRKSLFVVKSLMTIQYLMVMNENKKKLKWLRHLIRRFSLSFCRQSETNFFFFLGGEERQSVSYNLIGTVQYKFIKYIHFKQEYSVYITPGFLLKCSLISLSVLFSVLGTRQQKYRTLVNPIKPNNPNAPYKVIASRKYGQYLDMKKLRKKYDPAPMLQPRFLLLEGKKKDKC